MKELGYPMTCVWEVTMACNMRCKHCGSSCEHSLPDELTTEEALKFVDMCKDMNLGWVNLSGGEPLTRKDIFEIAYKLESYGIGVNIITNGWLIDDAMIEKLKKISSLRIAISLDGTKDLHDFIRKDGAFEHATNALKKLQAAGISTACITTITKKNIDKLSEIYKVLLDCKVEAWQLQIGLPMGNLEKHPDWVIEPSDVKRIIDFCYETSNENKIYVYPADCIGYYDKKLDAIYRKSFGNDVDCEWEGCHAGVRSFGILHNGDILGCTSIRDKSFIEGNIRERTLRDIWFDEKSFSWRRNFNKSCLKGACLKCERAEKCLGGCFNTRISINKDISSENQYCVYNQFLKK